MKVTLEMKDAPSFLAALVKEGVLFNARQINDYTIVIEFTGGF